MPSFFLSFATSVLSTLFAIMIENKVFRWCFNFFHYLRFDLKLAIHQDFLFLLVLLFVFVSWILVRTLWHFYYKRNPDIYRVESVWTLSLFLSLSFVFSEWLLETVDCAGKDSGA